MPAAGPYAGRVSEVAISNAASTDPTTATYVAVEKVRNPALPQSAATARTSSNDSSGNEQYIQTWSSGTFTFNMVADENDTGQGHVWTQKINGEKRSFRYRPTGDVSGNFQYRFVGIITAINIGTPLDDVATYDVTVQVDGAVTRSSQ